MMFNYGGSASPIDPMRMAVGQHNYSPLSKLLQQQPQALQQLGMQQQPGPDVIGFPGDRGTPFDPSAGIGGFQPDLTPRLFDSSAGGGDFEARQFPPQQFQAPRQQSYQPMPQAPGMQPLLQQFRTQQRPYQSPFQQRSGQMSPDGTMGGQSNSAYSYNNSLFGQMNNLAPLNKNALNFSY
jgi:hypothetical protein